jgi:gas vesicle protein
MTSLIRFRTLFVAAAMLIAPAACNKDKTGKDSDKAAEAVKSSADKLRDEARDVRETAADRREDLTDKAADKAEDTAKDMKDLAQDSSERTNKAIDRNEKQASDVKSDIADRRDDISEKARDNARDVADEAKDVGKGARKLADAEHDFKYAKMVRVQTLRSIHAVIASQPMVINSFASSLPFVESDRALINEKLQILQMRLDEAGNQIETLNGVSADSWEQRHDDVNKAMDRLEDARKDAWKALDNAKRLDRTSMR